MFETYRAYKSHFLGQFYLLALSKFFKDTVLMNGFNVNSNNNEFIHTLVTTDFGVTTSNRTLKSSKTQRVNHPILYDF